MVSPCAFISSRDARLCTCVRVCCARARTRTRACFSRTQVRAARNTPSGGRCCRTFYKRGVPLKPPRFICGAVFLGNEPHKPSMPSACLQVRKKRRHQVSDERLFYEEKNEGEYKLFSDVYDDGTRILRSLQTARVSASSTSDRSHRSHYRGDSA